MLESVNEDKADADSIEEIDGEVASDGEGDAEFSDEEPDVSEEDLNESVPLQTGEQVSKSSSDHGQGHVYELHSETSSNSK